jgi:hypothetical protein
VRHRAQSAKMSEGTKVALIVGGVTVTGVILYLVLRPSPNTPGAPVNAIAPTTPPPVDQNAAAKAQANAEANAARAAAASAAVQAAQANANRADFLFQPSGPERAGLSMGQTVHIAPVTTGPGVTWQYVLAPPPSGGPFNMPPVLQDMGNGTFKAIATGTATVHVTPGAMETFTNQGGPHSSWVAEFGPGYDVTIVVS